MPAEAREQAPSALWWGGEAQTNAITPPPHRHCATPPSAPPPTAWGAWGQADTPALTPAPQGLSAPTTGQQTAYTQPETQPV